MNLEENRGVNFASITVIPLEITVMKTLRKERIDTISTVFWACQEEPNF